MEEDLKILEEFIEDYSLNEELADDHFIEALENLIKDYRDGEDIIKKTVKENLEYKQYIRELEEENKQLKTRRIIGSIYDVKIEDLKDVLSPYYIPKSVIKEKIDKKQKQLELLKKKLQGRQTNFVNKNIITGQIQVLQELLEKRK